jgi:hypothetical protein
MPQFGLRSLLAIVTVSAIAIGFVRSCGAVAAVSLLLFIVSCVLLWGAVREDARTGRLVCLGAAVIAFFGAICYLAEATNWQATR